MVSQQESTTVEFSGNKRERELAAKIFGLMAARGMFMSSDAPIKLPLEMVSQYLESQGEANATAHIEAAVAANPTVFVIEIEDEQPFIVTTKSGQAPLRVVQVEKHSFSARFLTPLPKPDRPVTPRPRPRPEMPVIDVLAGIELTPQELEPEVVVLPPLEPELAAVEEAPAVVARTITTQVAKPTDVADVDDVDLALA